MSDTTIEVNNLSICFNLGNQKIDSIKDYFIQQVKRRISVTPFWALQDVSFTLKKGDTLGIVGYNGSGKSTLLKSVAGILRPTKGTVRTSGYIAPLIELGAGFDHDLSARENIFLNGALLGYDRTFMRTKLDEIIEFAELKDFTEVPLKNYSSGMLSRLGFAVATMNQPDILILDEVLSVGDYKFQKKSLARTREIANNGATVLFVSHSAEQVAEICDKAIWLDHGKVLMTGPTKEVAMAYAQHEREE